VIEEHPVEHLHVQSSEISLFDDTQTGTGIPGQNGLGQVEEKRRSAVPRSSSTSLSPIWVPA